MDQTHIHLLINHLPVFGSILGAVVLAQGMWRKSSSTIIAAYTLFIISALGGGIAYLTGEPAEETIENIQGINEIMLEEHEEFAIVALISFIVLGVASLIGMYVEMRQLRISKNVAVLMLLISIISFGLVGWTGLLGGQIRHTEINASAPFQSPQENEEDD